MQNFIELKTLKLVDDLVPFKRDKFREFVADHTYNLKNAEEKIQTIVDEVELTVFEDMSIAQLLEASVLAAAQNIQNDVEYDALATRFAATGIYLKALKFNETDTDFTAVYRRGFAQYINKGIDNKMLAPEMGSLFDLEELANALRIENDNIFKYIGINTMENRYMLKDFDQNTMETPQYMWMRIAMGISLKEENPTEQAKIFYNKLSTIEYIPGGSTNIAAGTTIPVLSNCYLLDTEDDTVHIFENVKNIALISKATGGIGISVTKLRAAGSVVKSNNTQSTGPIPFIKVMDSALKSMSRAGKKTGAMCIYMENWHINFPEFMDLRQNAGDDYRRVRTADTAVYISDEFMKRVVNNEKWYMFDPAEVAELTELYGSEFSKKYQEYCDKADRGEMRMHKIVPAREQMKQILTSMQSTSHPWLTWKDTINLRALNNNTGTIHASNLCTEITLPQNRDNIAVCNLLYINVTHHVRAEGTTPEDKMDWNKLEETVRTGIRHLDNLIDVNLSPLPETKNSDENNRAVGMGIMGMSEVFELFGYAYDSVEAYELMDRVAEFISYMSIDESANLAEQRGSYNNFEGSMWSKGYVPLDTINKVAKDRVADGHGAAQPEENKSTDVVTKSLEVLKSRIQNGVQNATSEESKELYEIFQQLTSLLPSENKEEVVAEDDSLAQLNKHGKGIELKQNRTYRMDWHKLRERVKKGMRNATTMAIAPNASTGLVAGTTPGLDPRFAQIFSRATSRGKFLDINHNLVKDLENLGIWNEVKNQVLENYGDVAEIDEIPEDLKKIYKTSFQVSPYAYLEIASRAQKWIDQSISRNMYLETRDVDEMVEIYTEAWRRGLKTTYYLHVKPRHTAEQSTVKVNKAIKLNKKGFGSLTTQESFNEEVAKPKKGFGFAANQPQEAPVEVPKKAGFGFAGVTPEVEKTTEAKFSYSETEVEEKVEMGMQANLKPEKKDKPKFINCPIDPAERALCEACQ